MRTYGWTDKVKPTIKKNETYLKDISKNDHEEYKLTNNLGQLIVKEENTRLVKV